MIGYVCFLGSIRIIFTIPLLVFISFPYHSVGIPMTRAILVNSTSCPLRPLRHCNKEPCSFMVNPPSPYEIAPGEKEMPRELSSGSRRSFTACLMIASDSLFNSVIMVLSTSRRIRVSTNRYTMILPIQVINLIAVFS